MALQLRLLRQRLLLAAVLLLAATIGAASAALQLPIADTPYVEYVSHRFTSRAVPRVAQWPQLPFSVAKQVGGGKVKHK